MLKASQHVETDGEQIIKAKNELIKKKNEVRIIILSVIKV